MKSYGVTIQMKATEQYFPVVLFIKLYKVVLKSVDEILLCNHLNESCWAVLSCGIVYYAVRGGSYFRVCGWNHVVWPLKWNLFASIFSILQNEIWKFLSNFDYGQFLAIIELRQQVALFKERRQLLN